MIALKHPLTEVRYSRKKRMGNCAANLKVSDVKTHTENQTQEVSTQEVSETGVRLTWLNWGRLKKSLKNIIRRDEALILYNRD